MDFWGAVLISATGTTATATVLAPLKWKPVSTAEELSKARTDFAKDREYGQSIKTVHGLCTAVAESLRRKYQYRDEGRPMTYVEDLHKQYKGQRILAR